MSLLEIKQEISRMSRRKRQELQAYLLCLKHERTEWKRTTAKRLLAVSKGKSVSLEELEKRARGG